MSDLPRGIVPISAEMVSYRTMRMYTSTGYCDVTQHDNGSRTYKNVSFSLNSVREANQASRAHQGRAPLGDSHGAWQKSAEFSLAAWRQTGRTVDDLQDPSALRGFINNSDNAEFKAHDGRF